MQRKEQRKERTQERESVREEEKVWKRECVYVERGGRE